MDKVNAQIVINRVEGWEENLAQVRQILIDLERDMEIFMRFCEKEE